MARERARPHRRRRDPRTQPAVKRNAERFPEDFVFRLTASEAATLNRSQSVIGYQKRRHPRFPPFAFTEHGAIMAATVFHSPRAVEMSMCVFRAFVQLRELMHPSAPKRRGIGCTADVGGK